MRNEPQQDHTQLLHYTFCLNSKLSVAPVKQVKLRGITERLRVMLTLL